uniref:Uncharacterized protein n=1 Tax=Cuerna arida TaxID=1464854 RepID=A0A1B6FCE8_9HEMI
MAQYPTATILAAMFLSSGQSVFNLPYSSQDDCKCTTISSFIFLTAVFAWLSGKKLTLFKCPLPYKAAFFYELFISLFVFEMAIKMFWDPLECFFSTSLPALIDDCLSDSGCILGGLYCPGDHGIFILLIYTLAVTCLWAVLYGYGVISFSL